MAVTIADIAQQLGISQATVSRSLRQDRRIHPQTRSRVIETAIRMGYQGRTRQRAAPVKNRPTIGVLVGYGVEAMRSLPNVVRYLQGIEAEADATGVLLRVEGVEAHRGGAIARGEIRPGVLEPRAVDAVIMIGRFADDDAAAVAASVPPLSLNWIRPGIHGDAVAPDNAGAIRNLVLDLVARGHRRLAWVDGWHPASFFEARMSGFIQGCLAAELPLTEQLIIPQREVAKGWDRVVDLLRPAVSGGVTSVACSNDEAAGNVGDRLIAQGLAIPDDVTLTGFDATGHRLPNGRVVTSIDPHFVELGRTAVRFALQRLRHPAGTRLVVQHACSTLAGETVADPRSRL